MENVSNYGFYLMVNNYQKNFKTATLSVLEKMQKGIQFFSLVLGICKKGQKTPEKLLIMI